MEEESGRKQRGLVRRGGWGRRGEGRGEWRREEGGRAAITFLSLFTCLSVPSFSLCALNLKMSNQ